MDAHQSTSQPQPKEQPAAKKRDVFDILSVVGTLFSTFILATLTFVVNHQSDEVKNSLATFQNSVAKANLVHTLIDDFKTNDTRQDLALIGLNRSIGDVPDPEGRNRLMVAQIAKTIFRDRIASKTTAYDNTTLVAFAVLAERCSPSSQMALPSCAKDYAEALQKLHERASAVQAVIISDKNAKPGQSPRPAPSHAASAANTAATQYLAAAFSGVVYIQYARKPDEPVIEALRKFLDDSSHGALTVPGTEHVIGNYADSVRYFHETDRQAAETLATNVNTFFRSKGQERSFAAVAFGPRNDVPLGQVELWVAGSPTAATPASPRTAAPIR